MPLGRLAAIATLAFLVVVITATSALASTFVRRDPGNVLLSPGSTLTGAGSFTAMTSIGGDLSCTPSFDATVGASGGATVTATLNRFTLSPCTGTLGLSTTLMLLTGCHGLPPLGSLTLTSGSPAIVTLPTISLRCNSLDLSATGACYYRSTAATGAYNNATSTLYFTGFSWDRTTGATDDLGQTLCNAFDHTITMDFRHVRTTGGTTVTVTTS